MIVRIVSRGQFRLDDARLADLNRLDNEIVDAVRADDEGRFEIALAAMLDFVQVEGTPVPNEELVASDHILPPPDTTLDEARHDFAGEGLIPG